VHPFSFDLRLETVEPLDGTSDNDRKQRAVTEESNNFVLCLADNTIADFFTTLIKISEAALGGNRERCSRESHGIAFPGPSKKYALPQ